MVIQSLMTAVDFERILDDYCGRTLSHTPVTQTTSNITGEETLADGTPINIKCYVMKTGQTFNYKEWGLMEQGDMVGLFKVADSVQINSKVTVNGEVFRVKEKYDVPAVFDSSSTATYIYTVCSMVMIS